MNWLACAIVGALLGWWAEVLFGRGRGFHPDADRPRLGVWFWDVEPDRGSARWPAAAPSAANPRWRYALWAAALLAALLFVSGYYFRPLASNSYVVLWLLSMLFGTEAFLLSPRVVALMSGLAFGFWASRYRRAIGSRSSDFYEALLGTGTKSSWALQSAVAILALFAIVLAVKPDLLDKLEILKAGDVEAKFSNVSTTTREAGRLTSSIFSREATLEGWTHFGTAFRANSPRDNVVKLFDKSEVQTQRKQIRDRLFGHYIEPLAILLSCLKNLDRLDEVRRSRELVQLANAFRSRIRTDDGSGRLFDEDNWRELLSLIDKQVTELTKIIEEHKESMMPSVEKRCPLYKSVVRTNEQWTIRREQDAKDLGQWVAEAVKILKGTQGEKDYTLSYIDSYIVAAVGDVLALTLGNIEKADFLSLVKNKYPTETALLQPGLINLYYQLAEAKSLADTTWSLAEKIDELDQAMRGVDFVIVETQRKAAEAQRAGTRGDEGLTLSNYDDILKIYLTNKFAFTLKYLEIYFLRVLAGDPMDQQSKLRWMHAYRQIEDLLNLQGFPVVLAGSDLLVPRPGAQDLTMWRSVLNDISAQRPDIMFDVRIGMSLSSIMLTQDKVRKASAQSCSVSRFHLNRAKDITKGMNGPPLELDDAKLAQLRSYLLQVDAWIDASCDRV